MSRGVRDRLRHRGGFTFDDFGEQLVKNIARPVRAYRVGERAGPIEPPTSSPPALPLPDKPSIAVLPFQNMSGDPEQEYFADGMVEEIITALSRMRWLFVIARNSSFTYRNRAVDVKQIGRELGVRYVLEGSVRKAANRVRITGQLIDTATGAHLWADRFDGGLEEVFDLQRPGDARDGLLALSFRHPAHLHAEGNILCDRHVRVKRVGLEHHRDVSLRRMQVVHDLAANPDLS